MKSRDFIARFGVENIETHSLALVLGKMMGRQIVDSAIRRELPLGTYGREAWDQNVLPDMLERRDAILDAKRELRKRTGG